MKLIVETCEQAYPTRSSLLAHRNEQPHHPAQPSWSTHSILFALGYSGGSLLVSLTSEILPSV